jgi:G:T-mismatch repair DNA endonuclease (very short patch repair protein)
VENVGSEINEIIENISLRENVLNEIKNRILKNPCLYNKKGNLNSNLYKMIDSNDRLLLDRYLPRPSLGESVYCLLNDIYDYPICLECEINRVTFFYNAVKGYSKFCSIQCSRKNPESKNKRIETTLSRYGVTNSKKSAAVVEKTRQNNLKKYGVVSPSQLDEIKQKISSTLKENYQHHRHEIVEKKNSTFISKYGDHPNRLSSIKDQKKKDTKEKYGVEHTTQIPLVKEKIKNTLIERYDVTSFFKTPEAIEARRIRNFVKKEIANQTFLEKISEIDTSLYTRKELADLLSVSFTTVTTKIKTLNIPIKEASQNQISTIELEIRSFIESLGIENIIVNDRSILSGKEIDIFLPDYKLAIEVNGVYWHSEQHGKDQNYHLEKTIKCQEHGIQLLHIFDLEWYNDTKKEIWKSMIRSRLNLNQKIFARNCQIGVVDQSTAKEFCDMNHLQGYINGSTRLGLFYQNQLVQIIVLGKARYSNRAELELLRSTTMCGLTVVGGLSKLLANVSQSVISYADLRYSNGNSYKKCGFQLINVSKPNYFYLVDGKLESRIKYQKHKLSKLLEIYDHDKSEVDNMQNNNYYRVWDCGNYIFLKNR